MSEYMRNFVIGLTTAIALVGLAVLLMYFGEFRLFARPEYQITIHMNIAAGLREGSPVELNGVRIGWIERVWLHEQIEEYPVRARARIVEDHRIPVNVFASIDRSFLAGTASLQLVAHPPHEDRDQQFVRVDGHGELWVQARTLFDLITSELDERTKPMLRALDDFNRLAATYTAVGENINALIGNLNEEFDDAEPGETVRAAVVKLNEVLDEARSALRLANRWLEDDQLRTDFTRAVSNANLLIDAATETFARFGDLAESLEVEATALLQNLVPVADELATTLVEVRRITTLASEGRGTVAQLLNNPDLYESLLDASIRLERALAEAQLLIQKIQSEGVPVRW